MGSGVELEKQFTFGKLVAAGQETQRSRGSWLGTREQVCRTWALLWRESVH